MLEIRRLCVTVEHTPLLRDVSLTVAAGEMVAVVGPNGAGKSTLMKALCGEITPSQGEVWLEGQHLRTWPRRERAQIMAVLPQQTTLVFPFTVLDVVLMGRTPHLRGAETARDYTIARAALDAAGMLAYAHRIYPTLSGGERQRVQFARVMAQVWEAVPARARYLLLDEPTSNLDLAYQQSTLETARQFARRETGVLTILHDLNLAAQFADRIIVLKDGQQLAVGGPHEVLTPATIRAAFAVSVTVMPHPRLPCPLVVPVPQMA
jgi:iron complex transport system ATP-binding protein